MNTMPKLIAFICLSAASVLVVVILKSQITIGPKPSPPPEPVSLEVKFDGGLTASMLMMCGFSNIVIHAQREGMPGRIVLLDETNGIMSAPVEYPKR